jgi:hypothetical protein
VHDTCMHGDTHTLRAPDFGIVRLNFCRCMSHGGCLVRTHATFKLILSLSSPAFYLRPEIPFFLHLLFS